MSFLQLEEEEFIDFGDALGSDEDGKGD